MINQFTPKITYSEKAIYFLSLMSCSINTLKSYMLFTCKSFMFSDFTRKKTYFPPGNDGRGLACAFPTALVYKDNYSSYVDLLAKDKLFTIHQRNIQSLAIELFKVKRNLSYVIMCNILKSRTITYNLRSQTDFASIHDVMVGIY